MLKNRIEAGRQLSQKILESLEIKNALVLAIPRGGVVVGFEIAKKLGCTLDVAIAKKITPPDHPEYAVGAITHEGTIYEGPHWKNYSRIVNFQNEIEKKKNEAKRRLVEYRGDAKYSLDGKTIILVDDGIATGATVFVLLKWLEKQKTNQIILAVPVIASHTYEELQKYVDMIFALEIPTEFFSVGQFYKEFDQVSDNEVIAILEKFQKD